MSCKGKQKRGERGRNKKGATTKTLGRTKVGFKAGRHEVEKGGIKAGKR